MGVKRLLSYLRRTYPDITKSARPFLSHVYLDANALLYAIAEDTKVPAEIGKVLLETAQAYGTVYRATVHIALDGAAHMGKLREQRFRRFLYEPPAVLTELTVPPGQREGSIEVGTGTLWTPAMFSPGTEMMEAITTYVEENMAEYPTVGTFSSYREPGEGEHKIVRDIRKLPEGTRAGIVGKDADLLLLGMLLAEEGYDAWVLRHDDTPNGKENGYRPDDPLWNISCRQLRSQILDTIRKPSIWDFIIATFLLGNDFLPPVPELSDLYAVMPVMMTTLRRQKERLYQDGISWPGLIRYILAVGSTVGVNNAWLDTHAQNQEAFTELFYARMYPLGVDRSRLLEAWVITMEWVALYYGQGLEAASVAWQYPTIAAPTMHLLAQLSTYDKYEQAKEIAARSYPPLQPTQALSGVLPPWLWVLLPANKRQKLKGYRQYYPYAFDRIPTTDTPLLPIIPYEILASL